MMPRQVERAAVPRAPEARSAVERALDWAVRLCLLLAALTLVGGMLGFVIVWAGLVVPGWALAAALLAVTVILATVRALVRRRRARVGGGAGADAGADASGRRRPSWIAGTAVAGVLAGVGIVADLPETYTVLTPAGPGSCQLAVREHSFLLASGGEVDVVGLGGLGRSVGSWTADDGAQPVASGSYDVAWDGGDALLSSSSDPGNPVWPAQHAVSCP